jgi:hypothetical protein
VGRRLRLDLLQDRDRGARVSLALLRVGDALAGDDRKGVLGGPGGEEGLEVGDGRVPRPEAEQQLQRLGGAK